MKKLMIFSGALASLAVCAGVVPEVSGITMTQPEDSRLVTITYNLANTDAIVTLDIQTNVTENVWASIGGENIQNVSGDVWKKVEAGNGHTITWHPDLSWPNHKIANGNARAVVTAWSVDNPPDYLVVSIAANAVTNSETYYPAVEFLPGGLLKNPDYRTSKIVMRKIPAKGVEWTMGSGETELGRVAAQEAAHTVTFDDNYYIAVFETTQEQWARIRTDNPKPSKFTVERAMRPVEMVSYNWIRNNGAVDDYNYPKDPDPGSFLGVLRTKTGLAFDLPSEAQWEFACRAGHGTGSWGDGTPIENETTDASLARIGRFFYSDGYVVNSSGGYDYPDVTRCGVTNGTANVGSYAPNSWGLYDMHGNVIEWCLDSYLADITNLGGAVCTAGNAWSNRSARGGGFKSYSKAGRAAQRVNFGPAGLGDDVGFRIALPASPAIKTTTE